MIIATEKLQIVHIVVQILFDDTRSIHTTNGSHNGDQDQTNKVEEVNEKYQVFEKMATYVHNNKLMIHYFQDSLSGASLKWYMNLEKSKI